MKKKNAKAKKSSGRKVSADEITDERTELVAEYFASKNRQRKRELERKISELDTKFEQLES